MIFFFHNLNGIVDCGGAVHYGRELIVLDKFPFKFETVFKCGKRIDNFRFRCLNRRQRDEQSEWHRTERNQTEQNKTELNWSVRKFLLNKWLWSPHDQINRENKLTGCVDLSLFCSLIPFYNFHHNFWLHSDHYGYWSSQDFSLENQFVGRFCFPFGSFHLRHKEIIYFFSNHKITTKLIHFSMCSRSPRSQRRKMLNAIFKAIGFFVVLFFSSWILKVI